MYIPIRNHGFYDDPRNDLYATRALGRVDRIATSRLSTSSGWYIFQNLVATLVILAGYVVAAVTLSAGSQEAVVLSVLLGGAIVGGGTLLYFLEADHYWVSQILSAVAYAWLNRKKYRATLIHIDESKAAIFLAAQAKDGPGNTYCDLSDVRRWFLGHASWSPQIDALLTDPRVVKMEVALQSTSDSTSEAAAKMRSELRAKLVVYVATLAAEIRDKEAADASAAEKARLNTLADCLESTPDTPESTWQQPGQTPQPDMV